MPVPFSIFERIHAEPLSERLGVVPQEHWPIWHELGRQRPDWRYPSDRWVKDCERLLALEKKLPDVLGGEAASPAEFVNRAVDFANDGIWGTLNVTLLAHPSSLKDAAVGKAIDQAITTLRFGIPSITRTITRSRSSPEWRARGRGSIQRRIWAGAAARGVCAPALPHGSPRSTAR